MNAAGDQNGSNQHSVLHGLSMDGPSIPWAEIFSRHETVLSSHLQMLDEVKGHVSDDEALRTVSSMLNKTIQAMSQLKFVRKYTQTSDNPFQSTSTTSKTRAAESPTPQSTDTEYTARRKRSRTDRDLEPSASVDPAEESRSSKRKRDTPSYQLPINPPDSNETEDISEEVQRRLRIKEEQRRKKENSQPEKRKRDSMISNESTSPGPSRHRKKRPRVGDELSMSELAGGSVNDEGRTKKMKKVR
ncbi:uncharacterized protein N7484_003996 [Penicillium longicatenatum]|uniref:uncharacterized protein n=1 Tax=Penicillium longicatenatum TaxID=1561947 RepID=UPI002546E048|nr:uncharacterized protein N7484_003996 [Penicillium longicatenatum]KAJ5650273.1 hypothetical protein N7484_003996 [Penicillium longicatenatum]